MPILKEPARSCLFRWWILTTKMWYQTCQFINHQIRYSPPRSAGGAIPTQWSSLPLLSPLQFCSIKLEFLLAPYKISWKRVSDEDISPRIMRENLQKENSFTSWMRAFILHAVSSTKESPLLEETEQCCLIISAEIRALRLQFMQTTTLHQGFCWVPRCFYCWRKIFHLSQLEHYFWCVRWCGILCRKALIL